VKSLLQNPRGRKKVRPNYRYQKNFLYKYGTTILQWTVQYSTVLLLRSAANKCSYSCIKYFFTKYNLVRRRTHVDKGYGSERENLCDAPPSNTVFLAYVV
jgi:hypothetical protein